MEPVCVVPPIVVVPVVAEVPNVVEPDVEPLNVIVLVAESVPETDVVPTESEAIVPAPRTVNVPST
jgi:hypothetical protein